MSDHTEMSAALTRVLGNSYVLYVKTHSYHWNVTGPNFHSLHTMFEEQYRDIWASLDDIAERIRALGAFAPVSSRVMAETANIEEADNDVPSAQVMLQNLVEDHSRWLKDAESALDEASENGDTGTEDLLAPLISAHEKMRWMLKSSLGD
ncbi:MAG: DNA starvation/stationary phase protection protein [Pseudomonadota bacterium]